MGSGCGAVGRAVTYDTRGPGFDSSHRQLLLNIYLLLTVCRKDENKEKRGREWPIFKKLLFIQFEQSSGIETKLTGGQKQTYSDTTP